LKHDIVQKARANGGNAVIFVSSESQLAAYHTEFSASSATTVPYTRRNSTYVVIRYLD
jgi:hypothetical protein